ncbi:MAG: hypothetical protein QM761_05900 [Pseudoxanthomonas sp.]
MKPKHLLTTCLLIAIPALAPAQSTADTETDTASAEALDLSLPKSSTIYGNDPPGTWYGDTSGVPAATAETPRKASACPTAANGEPSEITGSVAAGVGYSSRGGNSNYQAARVNYCKEYATDDGDTRAVNVSISVGQFDGPDGRYYRAAPPPMGGPRR